MKRLFDMILAGLGLLTLAPFLALLAAGVRLTSGAPIFFRQTRVGRNGRDFTLLKFRSMTVARGTERGSFDAGSASRVTPFGRLLRRTKLDELPQLWNVVRGDMSLVGPRPEVRKWVEVYAERWSRVLRVRPGITDPASIIYRDEETLLASAADPERTYRDKVLPQKLSLYEQYVAEPSLGRDISILWRTLRAVLRF